jgi:hypothetical protein
MRLADLEQTISAFRGNFHQAGRALLKIRDKALYREVLFDSFPDYVKTRWDISRSQAYRLMNAARVMDNLSPIGDILPQTESQARVLAELSFHDQRRVWRDFLASGRPLTAKNLRKLVKGKKAKAGRLNTAPIVSADFKAAAMAMVEQIRRARDDNWQATSKQTGLYWVRVMKDLIYGKR